ncbi:KxYKxGKxW signal peptide domain-containing protein [Limosilactobacillus reuteri]
MSSKKHFKLYKSGKK